MEVLDRRLGGVIRVTELIVLWCRECHAERSFEQLQCLEGHGNDCTEWLCVDCGFAVIVGDLVVETPDAAAISSDRAA
jgi:hypothetical protein